MEAEDASIGSYFRIGIIVSSFCDSNIFLTKFISDSCSIELERALCG